MSKVAVLGYGTVGSGVVHVLSENADIISKKAGESIEVARVLDLRDFPGDPIQEKVTHDFADIENDADIDIVVETMGGTKPAYDFVKRSILAGKSVCTSNKALVADHGTELIRIAREKGVHFFFEASVGGGIPILRPLNRCIVADEILSIRGILNGTTNFILTKMADEGSDYADVLKEAQALGYAEAYGAQVDYEDIHTEGITDISATDIAYAKKLGYMIRLLGMSTRSDGKLYALVAPFMIPHSDPLYSVGGVFNAITLTGNMLGEVMFYGQGAGKDATASAVVTDIVEAVKNRDTAVTIRWDEEKQTISSTGSMVSRFFVRLDAGSRDAVGTVFPGAELTDGVKDDEIGFVTGEMSEKDFESALGKLNGVVKSIRCM